MADQSEKFDAFAAGTAALAASGTATLELAMAGLPTVVAYKANRLTAAIFRRVALVKHVGLVNIIAGREVQPEFLQERCRPDRLAAAVAALLRDPAIAEAQRAAFREVKDQLFVPVAPSERAADAILDLLSARRVLPPAQPVRTAAAGP
jgi:lipid-A-disaccharide synthase